ncbi:MAG: hypothetical protein AAGU75_21600 [Bacillota bacterium]|jgi:hypothetical protein
MKSKNNLTDLQLCILTILNNHVGEENRIPRAELLEELHHNGFYVSDSSMRANIEMLRCSSWGAYICSTLKGGYWRAKNLSEISTYIKVDERRAKNILYRLSRQRKYATRNMTMDSLPIRDKK